MDLVITIDFGSTFTKGALIDLGRRSIIGTAYEPSTVETDVRVGLRAVLRQLEAIADRPLKGVPCVVCSSAAGGLRMVVIGLVPSLSLEAAQRAALGAGAKIVGAFGHKLPPSTLRAVLASRPDLVLLAGGIDGGDEETILHNARALAASDISAPIIVAGNCSVSDDCCTVLSAAGKTSLHAPNILPEIDRIEIEQVHKVIRDLFVRHITRAKGIERVADEVNLVAEIIPTPSAVLAACKLLAEGSSDRSGWGDLVIADIGGATTDIHSAATGLPTKPGVIPRGLPELFLKRTVEGDLGMRANARTILERVGTASVLALANSLAQQKLSEIDLQAYAEGVAADSAFVPANEAQVAMDAAMARAAIGLAMERHAGTVREIFTASGQALIQYGKDLSNVATVIGVGGVLARGKYARFALEGVIKGGGSDRALCPLKPRLLIDRSYVLYAVGLIANVAPAAAFDIAEQHTVPAA